MGEGRDRDHPTKLLCSGKLHNFLPMLQVPVEEEAEALEQFKAISAAHQARRQKHYTGTCWFDVRGSNIVSSTSVVAFSHWSRNGNVLVPTDEHTLYLLLHWQVLSNPGARRRYDLSLSVWPGDLLLGDSQQRWDLQISVGAQAVCLVSGHTLQQPTCCTTVTVVSDSMCDIIKITYDIMLQNMISYVIMSL